MSHVGHPMLGDTIYAPRNVIVAAGRLCLHARRISLKHPFTGLPLMIDTVNGVASGIEEPDEFDGRKSLDDGTICHELGKRKAVFADESC